MKRTIFLFTGFGFIGLNLIRILKKKFNIKVFGNKINYPFKLKLLENKVKFIKCDFLDIKKLRRYNFKNSNIILTTTDSNKKDFLNKYQKFIKFLKSKDPKKIILISSVSIYGNKFPKKSLYEYCPYIALVLATLPIIYRLLSLAISWGYCRCRFPTQEKL